MLLKNLRTRNALVAAIAAVTLAGITTAHNATADDAPVVSGPLQAVIRINSGGGAIVDDEGRSWQADAYYTYSPGVGGTTDEPRPQSKADVFKDNSVYKDARWNMPGYDIPIADGRYLVRLHLAEINPDSGVRVFSAKPIFSDLNMVESVGAYKPFTKEAWVTVDDGVLRLDFSSKSNAASVNGIEVLKEMKVASPQSTSAPKATAPAPTAAPVTAASVKVAPVATATATAATPVPAALATSSNDVNGFKLVFSDDMNTNAPEGQFLSTYKNWSAYPWEYQDTSRRGRYDPNVISVKDGVMAMRLYTDSNGTSHVAAPIPNLPGGNDQLYGRYEVRFRADAVDGYKTAWLLWPQSDTWPRDGEIDFPEGNLNGTIEGYMHRQGATQGSDQAFGSSDAKYTDWHTAIMEWTPNKLNFILDGKTIMSTSERIPNTKMHWVLQTETALSGSVPANATGKVFVDYVKIWKYEG